MARVIPCETCVANTNTQTPLDVRDGKLHMSDAPGLGIEMNMDFMRANSE